MKLGVITVCDIDDYWMPGKEHPIHDIIKLIRLMKKLLQILKLLNMSQQQRLLFADEIKRLIKMYLYSQTQLTQMNHNLKNQH
jgi:thiamine kinase-like enzyme